MPTWSGRADARVSDSPVDRCCIVGAGPAGLSMADALKRAGIAWDQFDGNPEVGPRYDDHFVSGLMETNRGLYPLLGLMSHVIAQVITDQLRGHTESRGVSKAFARGRNRDLSGGIRFVGSDRHQDYVDARSYRRCLKGLIRQMGWPSYEPAAWQKELTVQ